MHAFLPSKRYCPSHYRSWLVAAHKSMKTSDIFSHLVSRARPIIGANQHVGRASEKGAASKQDSNNNGDAPSTPLAKKASAPSKRKMALMRAINKKNRKHGKAT